MQRAVHVSLGKDPYRTLVRVGGHEIVVDEPREAGGADTGPTPVELLLASLATCKVITVRMYADRKGWPLARVSAEAGVGAQDGFVVGAIDVAITLEGDLSDEQRARLLDVAGKCPVEKAIGRGVEVRSEGRG